ncbi:MAG: M23 family metallopeptidase [Pseudomonadota bacterium]
MSSQQTTPSVSAVYHMAVTATLAGGVALVGGVWSLGSARAAAPVAESLPSPIPSIDTVETPSAIAPPEAWYAADFAVPERAIVRAEGTLRRRQTLNELLTGLGASPADAYAALQPLYDNDLLDPRRLQPGLGAELTFDENKGSELTLVGLSIKSGDDHSLFVERLDQGEFAATKLSTKLFPAHKRVAETIDTTLYEAALSAGASDQQVADFAQVFAYDVDFQREIHPGDTFELVYEAFVDERGNPVRTGDLIYAALDSKATQKGFYRFETPDDSITDYYGADGASATKFLMKTPINGARLSSGFGFRRHPISGYNKLHRGTDFAAPTGTPVYAAGHGVIERSSRYGGYGHYVRIRHANGYKTAYAHLSRYGQGIRSGVRVRQGQVIGYVGSTGASTGPHLHYEVIRNGKHVNAMRLKLPTGRKLDGAMLEAFDLHRASIDQLRTELSPKVEALDEVETAATDTLLTPVSLRR